MRVGVPRAWMTLGGNVATTALCHTVQKNERDSAEMFDVRRAHRLHNSGARRHCTPGPVWEQQHLCLHRTSLRVALHNARSAS